MAEIKNRYDGKVIYSRDGSLRETIVRAVKGAANLRGANLMGANLMGADLRGADLGGADLRGADLRGADLRGADLGGADLGGADLMGANLMDADLKGVNCYRDSPDVFSECVRRLPVAAISPVGWSAIGQIVVHHLCWDSIKQRHAPAIMPVFELLANNGFTEWRDYFKEIIVAAPDCIAVTVSKE